jgi:predicted anti-sigma-YlaC factor YlaD
MRCGKAKKLISRSVDSALSTADSASLAEHLSHCASCRAERESLARAFDLLDEWQPGQPKLGYEAFLTRLDQRAGPVQNRTLVIAGMPRWATAGLVAASIACGVVAGLSGEQPKPRQIPSEQEVASAMHLNAFGDVVEGSITYSVDAAKQGGAVE